MLDALDAAAVRRWLTTGRDALHRLRPHIDALNVYPIADHDTGTNLSTTMDGAVAAVEGVPDDLELVWPALAEGALHAARGNSGALLALLFSGMSEVLAGGPAADGVRFAAALHRAAEAAYAAVPAPVEGTILSVARAAAVGARGRDLAAVARSAAAGAAAALTRTPEALPVLREAGVVDAGGCGWSVLLEVLADVICGEGAARAPTDLPLGTAYGGAPLTGAEKDCRYEVEYLLDAPESSVSRLRGQLDGLGDSAIVGGGPSRWTVHAHVSDAGAAIEAGLAVGRIRRVRVTALTRPTASGFSPGFLGPTPSRVTDPDPGRRAVVVLVPGPGLDRLFRAEAATIVESWPAREPSVGDLLDAIRATGKGEVIVLTNDRIVHPVAERAAEIGRRDGRQVAVVPCRSSIQALAALAVHDRDRGFHDDVIAMTAAARSTRWGEVTVAGERALTSAGICQPGDVLGLIDGDVVLIGDAVAAVCRELLDRLLAGGGELVTLVTGADAPDGLGEQLAEYLRATRLGLDVVVYAGGQPRYPLLAGVE